MPDVLIATDTKFKAVYDAGKSYAIEFVIIGTGLTYASTGDPAVLLPTGGTAITIKINQAISGAEQRVKITQITIDDVADMITAGLNFSSTFGMSFLPVILAGSKFKWVEGSGDYGGTDLNDIIFGSASSNELYGGEGNDEIHGAGGDDELYSEFGSDTLFGDKGDDYIWIGVYDDPQTSWAYGGSGNDQLVVYANNSAAHLYGDDGADYIESYGSVATIYGGAGNDYIRDSTDTATLYGNKGDDYIESFGSATTIYGGKGDDILHTFYGVDNAYGGRGNDTFHGGTRTGQGTDNLFGGNGADSFHFGRRDVATGGGGADVFIFDLATDLDKAVVKDFDLTKDHIQMVNAGLTSAADGFAEFGAHAADVVAGVKYVSGGDTIILKGVSLADLTVDHFI